MGSFASIPVKFEYTGNRLAKKTDYIINQSSIQCILCIY